MTTTLPRPADPAGPAATAGPARSRPRGTHRSPGLRSVRPAEQVLVGGVTGLAVVAAAALAPGDLGPGLTVVLVAFALAVVLLAAINPVSAVVLLLVACFLRTALPVPGLPLEPFVLSFAGVLGSAALAVLRRAHRAPRFGVLEGAMVLYLLWNIISAITPHALQAVEPGTGETLAVWRFILTGTMVPFALYVVGRAVFSRPAAVRRVLWTVVALTAYSSLVSVLQFTGPPALVWPRFIVSDPNWTDRAVGVFNQPVVNGLLLVTGFVTAVHLGGARQSAPWQRLLAGGVAASAAVAVYFTHTRAVWLAFAVVLVAGAVLSRRTRAWFVVPIVLAGAAIAVNWSSFTSEDRTAGGVGSTNELEDRLNGIATSLWALREEPLTGWGIGRFPAVNTYHHQAWSQDVDWARGFGIASHQNELGIAAELGLVGVALWLAVLALLGAALVRAVRALPDDESGRRGLAVTALLAMVTWFVIGMTVDLRFLDFANAVAFLLAGIAVAAHDTARRSPTPAPATGRRTQVRSSR